MTFFVLSGLSPLPPAVFAGTITVNVVSDKSLQITSHSTTVQMQAINMAGTMHLPLLIDASNVTFNSISGGVQTFVGASTFNSDIFQTAGIMSLPTFTVNPAPFADNNSERGAAIRNDVAGVNRFSIVNRSDDPAGKVDLNFSLGSAGGTGFNFTIEVVMLGGVPYAVLLVDDTIPAWGGMAFAAPQFIWENQLQTQVWMTLSVSGLLLARPLFTQASAAGIAGVNIPHGTAPTSPTNGDMWTTTAGAFIRINGVTKQFTLT